MDAGYATRYEDTLWESFWKSEGHSLLALLAWISKNIVTCLALQIGSNAERCSGLWPYAILRQSVFVLGGVKKMFFLFYLATKLIRRANLAIYICHFSNA
jgi:hypothetical protein